MRSSTRVTDALLGRDRRGRYRTSTSPTAILPQGPSRAASSSRTPWRWCGRAGYRVGNVDVTIHAEEPKLAPHHRRDAGRHRRACSGSRPDAANVKATRGEGLGPIGRAEGDRGAGGPCCSSARSRPGGRRGSSRLATPRRCAETRAGHAARARLAASSTGEWLRLFRPPMLVAPLPDVICRPSGRVGRGVCPSRGPCVFIQRAMLAGSFCVEVRSGSNGSAKRVPVRASSERPMAKRDIKRSSVRRRSGRRRRSTALAGAQREDGDALPAAACSGTRRAASVRRLLRRSCWRAATTSRSRRRSYRGLA